MPPRPPASSAATPLYPIEDTKLAAALASLGFMCDAKPTHDVATDQTVCIFHFSGSSRRPQYQHLSLACAGAWLTGSLRTQQPMHPLCIAMRAMHNRARILDMVNQAAVMNLRTVADGHATEYRRDTQFDPRSNFSAATVPCDDLDLCAALAGVGIPMLTYEGTAKRRRFSLPQHGYTIKREVPGLPAQDRLEDAAQLIHRAPTAADPQRLALEDTDPLHPVVIAYDALAARALLRSLLDRRAPILHFKDEGTSALVSSQYTGRVMDSIAKRFGLLLP